MQIHNSMVTHKQVTAQLQVLEHKHGIRVLHVVECGSRAWGYSNVSSDVDIRFVYCQLPWARPIEDKLDTMRYEFEIDGIRYDLLGFELRKTMQKLSAGDMTMLETVFSHAKYGSKPEWLEVNGVALHYLNPHTLYQSSRDQAKRHLHIEQMSRSGEKLTAKSLMLSLRFSLIAAAIALHDVMEFSVPRLLQIHEVRFPWAKAAFEWLNANRGAEKSTLTSNPITMQIFDLFKAVDHMHPPTGKRDHNLTVANDVYGKLCQNVLATYHITNVNDLVI